MKTRETAFPKRWLIVLSIAAVTLLSVGFVFQGMISGDSSTPGASATATPVGGAQSESTGATATPVSDRQGDSEAATGITQERAISLAVQYGRSWGLKEFTGVYDIGIMKMLDFYALRGDEPTLGQSSVHQNIVWFVSLEGLREVCSPPDFYGKYHCADTNNMYVVLDAASGRVYSWGSRSEPLTIPR